MHGVLTGTWKDSLTINLYKFPNSSALRSNWIIWDPSLVGDQGWAPDGEWTTWVIAGAPYLKTLCIKFAAKWRTRLLGFFKYAYASKRIHFSFSAPLCLTDQTRCLSYWKQKPQFTTTHEWKKNIFRKFLHTLAKTYHPWNATSIWRIDSAAASAVDFKRVVVLIVPMRVIKLRFWESFPCETGSIRPNKY